MYSCPRCQTRLSSGVIRCGQCGAEVELLARLHELPNQYFNSALAAYRRGDLALANSLAGALLTARATDAEGWLLMGHILAAAGSYEIARQAWQMTALLQPGDPRSSDALAALDQFLMSRAAGVPAPTAS